MFNRVSTMNIMSRVSRVNLMNRVQSMFRVSGGCRVSKVRGKSKEKTMLG